MEKTVVNFSYAITVNSAPVSVYAVKPDGSRALISTFTTTGQHTFLAQTDQTEIEGDYDLLTGPLTTAAVIGTSPAIGTSGNSGSGDALSKDEIIDEVLSIIASPLSWEGPSATRNTQASYFQLGEAYLHKDIILSSVGYRCRFDGLAGCATSPVYLGIWEQSEDGENWKRLGVSTDTQIQAVNTDVMWFFAPGKVRLSGRPIRCCLLSSRDDDFRQDLIMGLRASATADPSTLLYDNGTVANVPKFFANGYKLPSAEESSGECSGGCGSLSMSEVLAEVIPAMTQEETVQNKQGNSDVSYYAGVISPDFLGGGGYLTSLSLTGRTSADSSIYTAPAYLKIMQIDSEGNWHTLGFSTNSQQQQISGSHVCTWEFDHLPLSGEPIVYLLASDNIYDTSPCGMIGSRIKNTDDNIGGYHTTSACVQADFIGCRCPKIQLTIRRLAGTAGAARQLQVSSVDLAILRKGCLHCDVLDDKTAQRYILLAAPSGSHADPSTVGFLINDFYYTRTGIKDVSITDNGVTIGSGANGGLSSCVIGNNASAGDTSLTLGNFGKALGVGNAVIHVGNNQSGEGELDICFFAAETPLANKYTDGEAGFGYECKKTDGTVERGCIALRDICTQHSADFDHLIQY